MRLIAATEASISGVSTVSSFSGASVASAAAACLAMPVPNSSYPEKTLSRPRWNGSILIRHRDLAARRADLCLQGHKALPCLGIRVCGKFGLSRRQFLFQFRQAVTLHGLPPTPLDLFRRGVRSCKRFNDPPSPADDGIKQGPESLLPQMGREGLAVKPWMAGSFF